MYLKQITSQTCFFSQINKNSKIFIVLWDENIDSNPAKELSDKLVQRYGSKSEIINEPTKIEEWIKNDFKWVAYNKYLEDQKLIDQIKNATDESNN